MSGSPCPSSSASLAFGAGSERDEHAKIAVMVGSLLAAVLASAVLRRRNAVYRRIALADAVDDDGDGVPDAFQRRSPRDAPE